MNKKIILVTGASSGIGFDTSKLLASQGHIVYGAARNMDNLKKLEEFGVKVLRLDVTDEESCKTCVEEIIRQEGRIDVLVNNAGYGSYGPIETVPIEEAKRQLDVNLFGLARMTQLVFPYMRENKSGRIINISSVAGRVTTYFGGWYHASKYAVEAISNSTRMDVKEFGIDVSIIEPGGIVSNWGLITADNLEKSTLDTVYEEKASRVAKTYRKMYSPDNKVLSRPILIAKAISKAVNSKKPKTRYILGFGSRTLIFLNAILPQRAFDWIMMKMFT